MTIVDLSILEKRYKTRASTISLLNGFSLKVEPGERVAIVGESGVGKSTLLNILGLLDTQFLGQYTVFGRDVKTLSQSEMARLRNQSIGFALQESALIQSLTISENIRLPLQYCSSQKLPAAYARFTEIVETIEITSILHKRPSDCSGGEKARATFARAVILNPQLLLADEPTASLDSENRDRLLDLMFALNFTNGTTIVTVTHASEVATRHDRIIQLERED